LAISFWIFTLISWFGVYPKMTDGTMTRLKALPQGAIDPWSCFMFDSSNGNGQLYPI